MINFFIRCATTPIYNFSNLHTAFRHAHGLAKREILQA